MAKRWLRACSTAVLVGALAVVACTPSQQATADAAFANPVVQDLLSHVPADTPYAWIGLEGSSRVFAEKMVKRAEPLLKQADGLLAAALASSGGSGESDRVARAIGAEFQGKLSLEGLQQLGFDLDARAVIYGLGLLPAVRVHMADATALKATIDRVQAASGVQFPVANHGGQDYWHGGDNKLEFVAAFVGNDLVAGVIVATPGPARDNTLAVLFGQARPDKSLAEVTVLKDLIATHGLGGFSAGFVDIRGLTEVLVGAGTGFNQETATALMAGSVPTPECVAEYRGLAGLVPRVAFGTTRLDDMGVETRMVAELRADLLAGLAAVRTKVPGLDGATGKDVMFGMGSAVDVGQALELAKAQAAIVEAAPFKCANLSWLNEAARGVVRGVPEAPPAVRSLRGFAFALEDVTMAGFLPTSVRGYTTVGTADPQGLIKTIKGLGGDEAAFIPDLAEEGVPQRLNFAGLPLPIPFEMFIAGRRDAGIAITAGGDAEKRAGAILTEQSEARPLFVFHMNMGRFMKLLPSGMDSQQTAIFSILGSQGYVVDAGDSGLVMRSWLNFAE